MTAGTEWTFLGIPIVNGAGTDVVTLTVHSFDQASQTGQYLNDIGKVRYGRMGPAEFAARWGGRRIGGVEVEGRAGHAVEALRQAGPPPGAERYRRTVRRGPS